MASRRSASGRRSAVEEVVESALPLVDGGALIIAEWDGGEHTRQIVLGLQQLTFARCLGGVEVTAGARHPVWALLEGGVGAIPALEVVVLPRFVVGSGAGGGGVTIDEYREGDDVTGEVPGVGVGPGERGGADFRVVLGGLG